MASPARLLLPLAAALLFPLAGAGAGDWIRPGEVWPDTDGRPIQAHGGGILAEGGLFYWFGEDRTPGLDPSRRYVACYASADLVHWRFRRRVLALGDVEGLGPTRILERPKVYHNAATGAYVMYFHVDGPVPGVPGDYGAARVGVAVSPTVDGDYCFLRSFRPLGHESRDIGQFVDDDGKAYLLFEDRPFGFRIAALSPDYLSVEREVCLVREHLEGCAIARVGGLYYVVGSQLTGWKPNANKYATATRLEGPWSPFRDIAPPGVNTYGSQSGFLLRLSGASGTAVIFVGDLWRPQDLSDSRYFWMPLRVRDGALALPPPRAWRMDLAAGIPIFGN
jgi:hypothetical protein